MRFRRKAHKAFHTISVQFFFPLLIPLFRLDRLSWIHDPSNLILKIENIKLKINEAVHADAAILPSFAPPPATLRRSGNFFLEWSIEK
jgi:hypothetical protein